MASRSRQTWLRLWEAMLGLCVLVSMASATERLCGKQLADALDLVCYGRGFYWSDKRSDSGSSGLSKRGSADAVVEETVRSLFRARRSVEATSSRPMAGRGVVVECCLNSCSYEVLESYCARPGDPPANVHAIFGGGQSAGAGDTSGSSNVVHGAPVALPEESGDPELAKSGRHHRQYFFVHLNLRPTRSPLA